MSNDPQQLIRQGIEAARLGNKEAARAFFEQALELDQRSEKAWFWLASVVESESERRICLNNVLQINPANARARAALNKMDERERELEKRKQEVAPGVPRRQAQLLAVLIIGVLLVVVVVAVVVVMGNNQREAELRAAQQAVEATQAQIAAADTAIAITATSAAEILRLTQEAIASPTPTMTNTPSEARGTLPPTWTWTPEPTVIPTRVPLAAPAEAGATGTLLLWGGRTLRQDKTYLPFGYVRLDDPDLTVVTITNNQLGMMPRFLEGAGKVMVIQQNLSDGDTYINTYNLDGSQPEPLAFRWQSSLISVVSQTSPLYSPQANAVTFSARPLTTMIQSIFVLSLGAGAPAGQPTATITPTIDSALVTPVLETPLPLEPTATRAATAVPPGPLRQITNDGALYTDPAWSPDGTRLVAVRDGSTTSQREPDIVIIDVATGSVTPVTSNGGGYIESSPRWSADGRRIFFTAALGSSPDQTGIWSSDLTGADAQALIDEPGLKERFPVPSPDGRFLAYASDRGGVFDIYLRDLTTGIDYQVTNTDDPDYPSDWWL